MTHILNNNQFLLYHRNDPVCQAVRPSVYLVMAIPKLMRHTFYIWLVSARK